MSVYSIQPLVPGEVRTYPLASRKSKVNVREFAKPDAWNSSRTKFLDSLPQILAGRELRQLLTAIHAALNSFPTRRSSDLAEINFSLRLVVLLRRVKHLS